MSSLREAQRAEELFTQYKETIYARTDRLFAKLFVIEYFAGIVAALVVSPRTWIGAQSSVHVHVIAAIVLGALIFSFPLYLIRTMPGKMITRHSVGISQMLFSALLIHLTGGRIETHFHVFGSLAFLAFYRDWRVLLSASIVVAADHFLRGAFWPASVYGTLFSSQWRWVEHTGWVLFEDIVLILALRQSVGEMKAVTERQAETEFKTSRLIKSENEFRTIFELAGSGKFEIDANTGRFLRVNRKLGEITGYSVEELLSLSLDRLFPENEHGERMTNYRKVISSSDDWTSERRYRRRDGTIFWGLISARILRDENGDPSRVISTLQDITDAKNTEQALGEAKIRAEEANHAKSAFLANMSHEIRTPLGAMLGFTELMTEDAALSEEQRKNLNTVLRNGEQLYRIINDILDLSKVEANKFEIESLRFDLNPVISDVAALLSFKAREKGLDLIVKSVGPLPESIVSDPTRFRQILTNIIGNAIKFTERGSVEVNFRFRDGQPTSLEVQVDDTGPGIPAEKTEHLFQPFAQADSATSRKFGGTGLGLYLSKRLSQALGGDLRLLRSDVGAGSSFLITIDAGPLEAKSLVKFARTDIHAVPEMAPTERLPDALKGQRVLVVDDSIDNLDLTRYILEGARAKVECVEGAQKALDRLANTSFDVVVMDIQMPGMDGYEAVRRLRERGYRAPVLALTAHAMKGERERCLEAGFDSYLVKPINRAELIRTIRLYAGRASARPDEAAAPPPAL